MTNQTETVELLKVCPSCGGAITRCSFSDAGGVRNFSLCCDVPLEIIDNWDVYEGLPENLQQVAVEKIKARYAEMTRVSKENARRFKENDERWQKSHPHLFKSDKQQIVPMHE